MTLAEIMTAVRSRFVSLVAEPNGLPVVHDNGPEPEPAAVPKWCRLTVSFSASAQASTGTPAHARFRHTGSMTANLFVPLQQGDAVLMALLDAIGHVFRGVTLVTPQVRFGSPYPIGVATPDRAWFTRAVQIPFSADTIGANG